MREYQRRVWLGAVAVLSLLAGAFTPAPLSAGSAREADLSSPAPDLVIEAITWSPEVPSIGNTVVFTVTIGNGGSRQAGPCHVAGYIDDAYQSSVAVDTVYPGTAVTRTFTWTAEAGAHTVRAVADSGNSVLESNENNNDMNFAFSVPAPDLTVEAITWSPEVPSIGDTVIFTVTVKNCGNSRARFSRIALSIDGLSRGYNEVPAIDAGDNVTTAFPWTARAGSHTVRAFADAISQVRESNELNNEKSANLSTATPDLIINTITWSPATLSENTTVTFTVTVKNQGTGKADYSRLAYYIDDTCHSSVHINPLDAGAVVSKTFTWVSEAGSHTFKAVADSQNGLVESDETNNEKEVTLPTLAPDLIVQKITWSPSTPLLNHRITLTVTIKNQGKTQACSSRLYMNIDNLYEGHLEIPAIDAGTTAVKTMGWTVNKDPHVIMAVADAENYVIEGDESNNTKTVTLSASSPSTSDLVIQGIAWSPASPATEDTVVFTVTIKNQSSYMANPSQVAFYIDDTLQDSVYVNQLDPLATVTKTFHWTAEAGSHTFKAVADHDDSVPESNETNNEKAVTLTTPAADIIIGDITWSPVLPSAGDAVTFTAAVRNQGVVRASPCAVAYYVDGDYRGYHAIQEISANATVTTTFTWTAQAGSHVIRIVADIENQVPEYDESNNEKQVTLPAPDLVIRDITWSPASPSENTTVTFTVTVENRGGGTAGASDVYLYVEGSWQDYRSVPEIEAGTSVTRTITWQAQKASGTVRAVADGENTVIESDESNNEKAVTLEVRPMPETATEPALTSEPAAAMETDFKEKEAGVQLQNVVTYVPLTEEIVFDFRAVNPAAGAVMTVELAIQVPAGMMVVSPEFVESDKGQYRASYSVEPGTVRPIEVRMLALVEGDFNILSDVSYYFGGDDSAAEHQVLNLPVTVGDSEAPAGSDGTAGSTWKGFLLKWWFVPAILVLAGASAAVILWLRRRTRKPGEEEAGTRAI